MGSERRINTARLWSGGLATAVVAALVVLVGTLVVRGVFGIPVLAPEEAGHFGDAGTLAYAALAALGALAATGLLYLLLLSAPRPLSFFGWIAGLATVVAAVTPFAQDASLASAVATALINLVAGMATVSLLSGVGAAARLAGRRQLRPTRGDGSLPGTGYDDEPRFTAPPPRDYGGRHRGQTPGAHARPHRD